MSAALTSIDRPIFILGCQQSGTTTFYKRMALFPELAWISTKTKRHTRWTWRTRLALWLKRNKQAKPREGNRIWAYGARRKDEFRDRSDVTPRVQKYLHRVVRDHIELLDKPRFLNKCPANALRVDFLDALFPDALFIHVIRDGRAVARGMRQGVDMGYMGHPVKVRGFERFESEPELERYALVWQECIEEARRGMAALAPERSMEIRYEDFVADPRGSFQAVAGFCGLGYDDALGERLSEGLENRNSKWPSKLKPEEILAIEARVGGMLDSFGYPRWQPPA